MKKPRKPSAPQGLAPAARALWARLQSEYDVRDAAGLTILEAALRSWCRAEEARVMLDREGVCFKDRWNQVRPHPAAVVERDSRAAFLAALRQLKIEIPLEG